MNAVNANAAHNSFPVNITKKEASFIDSTFRQELKQSRQRNTVRRNDDNGYGAALTCLARDMVTASPEEAQLIAAKMNFIQNLVNQNLKTDADIRTQKNDDSRAMIGTKADAYVKKAPCHTELIKTTAGSISSIVDSADKMISNVAPLDKYLSN